MTTGRINQVATFHPHTYQWAILTTTSEKHSAGHNCQPTKQPKATCQTTLVPQVSQSSGSFLFIVITLQCNVTKCHDLQRELPSTSAAQKLAHTGPGEFPIHYLLLAWPLASSPQPFINASILLLDYCMSREELHHSYSKLWPLPNQSDLTDRAYPWFSQWQASHPTNPSEAYWTWFIVNNNQAFNLRYHKKRLPWRFCLFLH